jgi:hypothetical protein
MTYDNNDGPIYSMLSGKSPCASEDIQNYLQRTNQVTCEGVNRIWEAFGGSAQDCIDEVMSYFNPDGSYSELQAQKYCCGCNY